MRRPLDIASRTSFRSVFSAEIFSSEKSLWTDPPAFCTCSGRILSAPSDSAIDAAFSRTSMAKRASPWGSALSAIRSRHPSSMTPGYRDRPALCTAICLSSGREYLSKRMVFARPKVERDAASRGRSSGDFWDIRINDIGWDESARLMRYIVSPPCPERSTSASSRMIMMGFPESFTCLTNEL